MWRVNGSEAPGWSARESCAIESAFNGLAFYRRTALACRYVHDGDCEHVSFHRCMRERNLAVRMSPVAHEVNATAVRAHLAVGAC